jgi:hypothetical protein
LDIDGSNSSTWIVQSIALLAATRYRFSGWNRETGAATAGVSMYDTVDANHHLQADGSWGVTGYQFPFGPNASFAPGIIEFISQAANNYAIYLRNVAATSESLWWDDASLIAIPTDCDGWTESALGSSIISQSATEQRSGSYCVRMDIDGVGSYAVISQNTVAAVAGDICTFSFYHKETGAATIKTWVKNPSGDSLQADGSWDAAVNVFNQAHASSWTRVELYFAANATGNYEVGVARLNATSETIYIDDASLTAVTLPANLLKDGEFDYWTSPIGLANWVEVEAGSSTVNQELTEAYDGYCVRLDVDGSNSAVGVRQTVSLFSGNVYRFSIYHKETGSATVKFYIKNASGDYLQADGTWDAASYSFDPAHADDWTIYEIGFTIVAAGNITFEIYNNNAANESVYVDSASLAIVTPFDSVSLPSELKFRLGELEDNQGFDLDATDESWLPGPQLKLNPVSLISYEESLPENINRVMEPGQNGAAFANGDPKTRGPRTARMKLGIHVFRKTSYMFGITDISNTF